MTAEVALGLALLAGLAIPAGALVSSNLYLRCACLRMEIDSFVSYFGGGALLAAIALVLIPGGIEVTSVTIASVAFAAGGLLFWQFSSWALRTGNSVAQFMGMVLDFFPEAILLGAAAASGSGVAYLLAGLIALQNMPEGFAAHHEMQAAGKSNMSLWLLFLSVPLLGPVAAWVGFEWLTSGSETLGALMLFCSGGILYLIFQDIAPNAHIKKKSFPAVGAISGFLLGMIGTMLLH